MDAIAIGSKAPEFTLPDINDKQLSLSDFKGKKVLLSWHPLAWTGVCTDQMRALEHNYDRLEALNTVALGMNVDPVPSKKAWAAVLGLKRLTLLSDFWPHGAVAKDCGIFIDKLGFSGRGNIIIDEEGLVRWVKVYALSELPDLNEVLEALAAN